MVGLVGLRLRGLRSAGLRVSRGSKCFNVVALVSSGYEADSPQLMIPTWLAKELGLRPPPPNTIEDVFETAGDP